MHTFYSSLKVKIAIAAGLFCYVISLAQEVKNDTVMVFEEKVILHPEPQKYPQFKVGGVFQTRYLNNFKKGVDIDGLHHSGESGTNNSFDIKRMRVSMNAKITENLEVTTLVNLADFKNSDVSTKVLENAYAKYTFSRYLQITVGQFRPLFGLEETYPVDIVKSIDYSNSYYLFGNNGWMSFQVGAALTGSVNLGSVPMSYGFSVMNGNGKNKTDNDDGKHYSSRLLFNLNRQHDFNVGFSGGIGEVQKQNVYAVGIEAAAKFPIGERWCFDFQTEAKQGTNHDAFFKLKPEEQLLGNLDDYVMKSFYIVPNIRYEIGRKHFQAIEFACRYEYLDAESKVNSNARQTWVPMFSLEFLKNYGARIQLGMQIDNYKKNIKDSKIYNSNLAFIQLQCRFQ
ncbi:porin [Myroides indicus]|uniref:Phosphate-selective porin O/P n=1 Tax=Myroides indicus TaxID=1323422 RepID=A0A4V3E7W4_9FLAO|nr:porin [Myroides indicus]TDS55261.1 phosphate-selective porin O/P [Myroides indicus]